MIYNVVTVAGICATPGDSGSPVFAAGTAVVVGIVVQELKTAAGRCAGVTVTRIKGVLDGYHLRLA
jgi:hypothetical protein